MVIPGSILETFVRNMLSLQVECLRIITHVVSMKQYFSHMLWRAFMNNPMAPFDVHSENLDADDDDNQSINKETTNKPINNMKLFFSMN